MVTGVYAHFGGQMVLIARRDYVSTAHGQVLSTTADIRTPDRPAVKRKLHKNGRIKFVGDWGTLNSCHVSDTFNVSHMFLII